MPAVAPARPLTGAVRLCLALAVVRASQAAEIRGSEGAGAGVGLAKELFTTNAVCKSQYCINPIFPGLGDLAKLSQVQWVTSSHGTVSQYLDFCRGVVLYDPALPSPLAPEPATTLIQRQEDAAATQFFYHLSAMGYEPWEHREPWSRRTDDCVKAVWKLTCFTYFPRAQVGSKEGESSPYLRPCQNACQSYVRECGVECCDESQQCVFQHQVQPLGSNVSLLLSGYTPADGPSAVCTGAAGWRGAPSRLILLALGVLQVPGGLGAGRASLAVLLGVAMYLQGCSTEIPTHATANWRKTLDYLIAYEYVPAGQTALAAKVNSCSPSSGAPADEQCGMHGYCMPWNATRVYDLNKARPLAFCQCDRDWADPECRTRRKSQLVAFLYSLFLGFLGADRMYLGWPMMGVLKLLTLGGGGLWWIYDVLRVGAGPVYAREHRVAPDLPHALFVGAIFLFLVSVGFAAALASAMRARQSKRQEVMLLQAKEESEGWDTGKEWARRHAGVQGYGAAGWAGAYF